jgi:H+/gluconate symporter-like permease
MQTSQSSSASPIKAPTLYEYIIATAIGLPFAALALFFLATIIGIPIGLLFGFIAGYPFYRVEKRKARHIVQEQNKNNKPQKGRAYKIYVYDGEDGEEPIKPWL